MDPSAMTELIFGLPEQMETALQLASSADLRIPGRSFKNICVLGMGGSAIGGDIVRSYAFHTLRLPMWVNRHYELPACVDEHSLVIACSYSGGTEETLAAYQQAVDRRAAIVCITSGGQLTEQAERHGHPIVRIPGGQPPRSALGYLCIPILTCLAQNGLMPPQEAAIEESVAVLRHMCETLHPDVQENTALIIAQQLYGKIPLILGSVPHVEAVAQRWKGQLSENAEVMAFANVFPELNHNEIMGWGPYRDLNRNIKVVYLRDREEHHRIRLRMTISKAIFEKHTGEVLEVHSSGTGLLARMFSLILWGDVVSLYLAFLNQVDPTAIENIDYLKRSLTNS